MNESNFTQVNSHCNFDEPESNAAKAAKLIACLVVGGFGIICNVFVIVLAVKYTVRKSLHFLIINMAVTDVLLTILQIYSVYFYLESIFDQIYNGRDRGLAGFICKTPLYFRQVLMTESLVTLLIISIERFRATRQIVHLSRPLSRKRSCAIIACSWLIAGTVNLGFLIFIKVQKTSEGFTICDYSGSYKIILAALLIPFFLMVLFYILMTVLSIVTLRRLSDVQPIEESLSEYQRQKRRQRIRGAVKMVLYSLVLYSCSWIPFYSYIIFSITNLYNSPCIDKKTMWFITLDFLPLVNICFSPSIYCVCLSDFRGAAGRILRCTNATNPARGTATANNTQRYQTTSI